MKAAGGTQASGTAPCYCDSGKTFADCCSPRIAGTAPAETAEQLMRSRYSAFAIMDEAYLLSSWHPKTRPSRVSFSDDLRWLGLKIRACQGGHDGDNRGQVEFLARYRQGGRAHRLHEISEFERLADGRWYYLSGQHLTRAKNPR